MFSSNLWKYPGMAQQDSFLVLPSTIPQYWPAEHAMPPGGTEDNLRLGVFRRVLKTLKAGENLLSPPLLQSSGTNSLYRQEKDGGGRGPAREVTGHLLSFCSSASVGPVLLTLGFLFLFSLVYTWLATLGLCQMNSKLVQLPMYRNLLLFEFFSLLGYYRIQHRVPCAIQ